MRYKHTHFEFASPGDEDRVRSRYEKRRPKGRADANDAKMLVGMREGEESRRKRRPARIRTGRIALQRMNVQLMPDAMRLERSAGMPTCGLATNMMQGYTWRWGIERSMSIVFSVKNAKERTEAAANFSLAGS